MAALCMEYKYLAHQQGTDPRAEEIVTETKSPVCCTAQCHFDQEAVMLPVPVHIVGTAARSQL